VIERHVTFNVLPDRTVDFERFFVEAYRPPVLGMPGLIECTLLRESEVHQGLQPALVELHAGMEITAYTKVA